MPEENYKYKSSPRIQNHREIKSIERNEHSWINIRDENNGTIGSQSVEANLLFEILKELRRIRMSTQNK